MKKTLLILSILLFSCNTENKLQKIIDDHTIVKNNYLRFQIGEDLNASFLKGKVKSVSYSEYSVIAKFGEIKKSEFNDKYYTLYNADGNMEYNVILNKDDLVIAYEEINYDENGYPTKYTEARINDYEDSYNIENDKKGNILIAKNKEGYNQYIYDKSGNLIEINVATNTDSLTNKYIYKYNKKNKQIENSWYNGEGKLMNRNRFEYDDDEKLVQEIEYLGDGSVNEVQKLEYDKKGNLYSYYNDNWLTGKTTKTFFYDKKGNLIKKEGIQEKNIIGTKCKLIIYTYDEKGNELERKDCDKVISKSDFKYDNNGNIIEEVFFGYDKETERVSEKITRRYVIEYDKNNNWIKRINYKNEFTPNTIEERKIEYYTTLESIFGVKDNNDIEKFLSNKQKYNLNGIEIINPEGYSYNEKKSNKIQLLFDKNDGSELMVMASKIKDRAITSDAIKKVILSGNDIIKWKLLEPLKSSSGDLSELATISYGPNGLSGYRTGFKFNSLLVMIDSYAKTPREAFKALLETSINIDKNNLKYFTSKDIKEMTKNATKDIIQNYLKENPQLLPFSDK